MARKHQQQTELPLAEGEASFAERKNELALAMLRVDPTHDLHLAQFVLWVFNATAGGLDGELKKTHAQIAGRPWGLCCSVAKARKTISHAIHLGLIHAEENRYVSRGQEANSYTIHWAGIRQILRHGHWSGRPGATSEQGGALLDHPPALIEQGGAPIEHPYIGITPLSTSRHLSPGPVPEPGPTTAAGVVGQTDLRHVAADDPLRRSLLAEHPLLRDACQRRLDPLDPGALVGNAFAPLSEAHLESTGSIVFWFRRQLGLQSPVTPDTEADLLLVLAAALFAARLPASQIRRSRVGLFAHTLTRRKWRTACSRLHDAHERYQAFLASQEKGVLV